MFGRKNKKSDLDWQPGDNPDAADVAPTSTRGAVMADLRQDEKPQQPDAPVYQIPAGSSDVWSGLVHPRSIMRFMRKQFLLITAVTMLVVVAGLATYIMLPSKYAAKALVLVDPRQPRVTDNDTVMSGIGGDAAALTSYVQIMKSDGFLAKVVEELGAKYDPEYAKAKSQTALVAMFRGNVEADRQGATYIVEINAKSRDKEFAAKYANGIAEAFVRDQKDYRSNANEEAARWLSERLKLLHSNLNASEEAVAAFRARNGIIDAGAQGTLDNQQLTSLVSQLGTVTTELADSKARYDQALKDGVPGSARSTQAGEFANLDQLMQEQDRLRREAAELSQTLGKRHPRMLANREQQSIIAGQIATERKRLVERAKQDYETTLAKKQALEGQLADLRQRSISLNKAMVELDNLEREANANRNLYEQFLARYKITDEQSQFNFSEARIVSKAPVPIKSTKPSIKLVGVALVALGLICGVLVALVRAAFAIPEYRQPEADISGRRNTGTLKEEETPDETAKKHDVEARDDMPAFAKKRVPVIKDIPNGPDLGKSAYQSVRTKGAAKPSASDKSPLFASQDAPKIELPSPTIGASLKADAAKGVEAKGKKDGSGESLKDKTGLLATAAASAVALKKTEMDEESAGPKDLPEPEQGELAIDAPARGLVAGSALAAGEDAERAEHVEAEQVENDENVEQDDKEKKSDSGKDPVVIRLPQLAASADGETDLPSGPEISTFFDSLNDFVKDKGNNDSTSMLVTSAQPGQGLEAATTLVTHFAVDAGYRPVVLSLQQQPKARMQVGGSASAAPETAKVEQFETHDFIPFVGGAGLSDAQGLNLALAEELANLIELCCETYGFVIVEAKQILTPNSLEDLIDLVDDALLVLECDDLNESELADWCEWAGETGVGLLLDQTQS